VIVAESKALRKMRKNPIGWRIEELQAVAEENSVEWRRPGRGGSHVIFSAPGVREIVSVPSKRPIKPVYVKQFLKLIDAAGGVKTK
jgi:HicA-like toxin of HicAB toxin-antitoxin system